MAEFAKDLEACRKAFSEGRYETTRRLTLRLLGNCNESPPQVEVLLLLHATLLELADFDAARRMQFAHADNLAQWPFQWELCRAKRYRRQANPAHYRTSVEKQQGYTLEEYLASYRKLAQEALEQVRRLAHSQAEKEELSAFEANPPRNHYGEPLPPLKEAPPTKGKGQLKGCLVDVEGHPLGNATVTLGLASKVESPDPATFVSHGMHFFPRIGQLSKLTTQSDNQGHFHFEDVPVGQHDFLAVTHDPDEQAITTRFLAREIKIVDGQTCDLGEFTFSNWVSAPAHEVSSHHLEILEGGWQLLEQWPLHNPFYYDFPCQLLTLPVEDTKAELRVQIEPGVDVPYQRLSEGKLALLTDLPAQSDRVIAVYAAEEPNEPPALLTPHLEFNQPSTNCWEVEVGTSRFRLAGPDSPPDEAPLQQVMGPDGIWRGQGRFRFPKHVEICSRDVRILEQGPILVTVEYDHLLSTGAHYRLKMTFVAGEPLMLASEYCASVQDAAFEFSLSEFSGGRGFLNWNAETGTRHWTTLKKREETVAELAESIPWWLPPSGFGFAMGPDGLKERDYIGVFTRRRGQWIDREFERVSHGPIDSSGKPNYELEWPFPEMVGSSISMITAQTNEQGDAFYRFGLFDGERHWGMLVSSFDQNDGPWREFGRLQHAFSSPRLQDFMQWKLDEADDHTRPHGIVQRAQLPKLRKKSKQAPFAGLWNKIRNEPVPGPAQGLAFAIDGDPLIAWRFKLELCAIADIRSKMTLLGRDWSDTYSPVGGRSITQWAEEYDLVAASGVFTPEEEHKIRAFFMLMGHMYMEEDLMNWRLGSRNANFESDRVEIVGTIGLIFQGRKDAATFIDHAVECTKRSLLAYCVPGSGKWYENPACYYLHASRCRMGLLFHLIRRGLLTLEDIPRLQDFLLWGIHLLTPPQPLHYQEMREGSHSIEQTQLNIRKVPPIGDHAGLGRWLPEHYACIGKLFRDQQHEFGDLLLEAYFHANGDGLRLRGGDEWVTQTPEADPVAPHTAAQFGNLPLLFGTLEPEDVERHSEFAPQSRRLEGYGAVFRQHVNTANEGYLLFKQGPGGYRYHRSEGSFIWFSHGAPLVYEGGEAGETWRHSTLSFHEVAMPLSPGRVERHYDGGGIQLLQGVHPVILKPGDPIFLNDVCHHHLIEESYRRWHLEPPAVSRGIVWIDGDYLLIFDDLRHANVALSHWHLHVVGRNPRELGPQDWFFPGRFGVGLRVCLPDQEFVSTSVQRQPILHNGVTEECCFATEHLCLGKHHAQGYLAVLQPCPDGHPRPLEIRALRQDGYHFGASIKHELGEDYVWCCRSEEQWSSDKVSFEGKTGAYLSRQDNQRFFLHGPGTLRANQLKLDSTCDTTMLVIRNGQFQLTATGAGRINLSSPQFQKSFETEHKDRTELNFEYA